MIKELNYGGYTVVPSDYECQDGQLAASLNLLNEDGHLKPLFLPEGENIGLASSQRAVFIHQTSAGAHFIIYDGSNFKLSWKKKGSSGTPTELDFIYEFSHCNAVGNTLMVFSDGGIRYLLWAGDKYTDLGDQLPHVNVSFGLVGHPRLLSQLDSKFNVTFAEGISEADIHSDFSDDNKTKVTEQVMAKLNKFIREQTVDAGRFCFPFFVRYALRMYDGSLVCHSAPILMNPATRPAPLVMWNRVKGKNDYTEATDCDIMMVAAALDYKVLNATVLDQWKDLIKSIDVFISKPIYTYDQNGKIANLTDIDNFQTSFIGKLYHDTYHRSGSATFPSDITQDCMVGPISTNGNENFLSRYMEWTYATIYQLYFTKESGRPYPGETFHLPEYTDGKNMESLESCATFYLLHSISLEDAKATTRKEVPVENDYLQSLVTREVMTDDYLTNDKLFATSSQSYNSRINLSGVRRKPFSGFCPLSMFAFCDSNATSYKVSGNTVQISVPTGSVIGPDIVSVTIYLKEGGQIYQLISSSNSMAPWGSDLLTVGGSQEKVRRTHSWGSYFFYPNVNAVKAVVTSSYGLPENAQSNDVANIVIDLKPHEFLNGAYAMLDYDSVRVHNYTSGSVPTVTTSPNDLIDCGNKVYTSEVNNPFFFPLLGINTVGTGRIKAISTAAKALSEGQFGQFPLYAFTDEGVWALEVSATGSYSARQPITRDVILDGTMPLQMDSAVLFATDRGIMLISGSQTQCISDIINTNEPFNVMQLPQMNKLHAMLGHTTDSCLPTVSFLKFLSGSGMLYDYVHQRVIVYNPAYTYAYVFSLKSREWGMMHSTIKSGINSYPEALAVDLSGKLLNFSDMEGTATKGLMVSRPLKLDAPDILKTVDAIIQRGNFAKGHVCSVLYGSRDLCNWFLIWSSKDHYLRGFRGTPYKYYRIACVTSLAAEESITGATVQFTPRLTDQPR